MYLVALKCRICGTEYPPEPLYHCSLCFGPLEAVYDYEEIKESVSKEEISKRVQSIWRYREFLPTNHEPVDLGAGFTRFIHAKNLGERLGLKNLYLLDDSTNPTYSFKDRVLSVAVTKALEFGMDVVGCASTGNLAGSLAAHAAKAGLRAFIFIPAGIEKNKIVQALVHGATVVEVNGSYDDANRLAAEIAEKNRSWGFVNINLRPYYVEGSKTLAFEAAERLGWGAPSQVVVPVASGALLYSIYRGFRELETVGLIDSAEVVFNAAQPEGFPVARAVKERRQIEPIERFNTIVHSLAIGNPADGIFAKEVVERSGGYAEDPSDAEVIEAVKLLARTEGIFTELAGGVTIAALIRLVEDGRIDRDEKVVTYLTGNGLKTSEAVAESLSTVKIDARVDEFEMVLGVMGWR